MKKLCSALAVITVFAVILCSCNRPVKVVLLGDSYTTFEGLIPEGYASWYFYNPDNEKQKDGDKTNDVHDPSQTWWNILLEETGAQLLFNSSYSGATICSVGYGGADYSDRSFVTRAKTDIVTPDGKPGRCGEFPDILLICGGTNDRWAFSPVGEVLPPSQWKDADLSQCFPATSYLFGYLKENLPSSTRIVFILNSGLGERFEKGFEEACELYGVEYMLLHDIDKQINHPSQAGMKAFAQQVKEAVWK